MFCNGFKRFYIQLLLFFNLYYIITKIFNYECISAFNSTGFNDSIILLSLISSTIYTLSFLLVNLMYRAIRYKTTHMYVICLLYLILLNYFFDFFAVGSSLINVFEVISLNTTLQNGLVNIHPFFIYALYGFFMLNVLLAYTSEHIYIIKLTSKSHLYYYLYLILIGIILGAWWAVQEFNWGGYWSWDPVELISLLLFLRLAYMSHNVDLNLKLTKWLHYWFVLFIIYCIMRLGIVSTIHSFIRTISLPYYVYIIVILNTMYIVIPKYIVNFFFIVTKFKTQATWLIRILLLTLIISLIELIYLNLQIPTFNIYSNLPHLYAVLFILVVYANLLHFLKLKIYSLIMHAIVFICCYYLTSTFTLLLVFSLFVFIEFTGINRLHSFLVWSYLIFSLTFVQFLIYSYNVATLTDKITINDFSFFITSGDFYEIGFYESKKIFIVTLKNIFQHILGFTTSADIISTVFIYMKTNVPKTMFVEEFLSSTILLIFIYFIYYNKYKDRSIIIYY